MSAAWTVKRTGPGGFVMRADEEAPIEVVPDGPGWRVSGLGDAGPLELGRPDEGPGFVLRRGSDRVARTSSLVRGATEANLYYLLLGDGRLFRIALRDARTGGFEIRGWETPGAYLQAVPTSDGWAIESTPAAGGMSGVRTLSILFAAELLDSEERLERGAVGA
ncbi:MAG: hypothetical protein GY716_04420 [bacterium]|nr:hypothetical protein [bacterium]